MNESGMKLESLKPYNISIQKKEDGEKNGEKDWKAFYKLMNNAAFSKTMGKLRSRLDVRLVNNKKEYLKWISKPSYIAQKMFGNNLVAICKIKQFWHLTILAYLRMRILELSKVTIYEFHHDYMENKYGSKSRLLFTDTDSLLYEIESEHICDDFSQNKELFGFSNYFARSKFPMI